MLQKSTRRTVNENGLDRPRFARVICTHPLMSAGLAHALESGGVCHGPGSPGDDVLHCVVLWADDREGLSEVVGRLREASPDSPVLILGPRNDLALARDALRAGARGFIHAGMTPEQINCALSVAMRGEIAAPRELIEFLLTDEDPSTKFDALSSRQREILKLLAEGLTNAQIGKRLYLSESTVKQHLRAAYKLLGAKNRTEAASLMRSASRMSCLGSRGSFLC